MPCTYDRLTVPRRYGWKPMLPGKYAAVAPWQKPKAQTFPPRFSLRANFPGCYDQGQLGSCTANALAGLLALALLREKRLSMAVANTPAGTPSRLMIYYLERLKEGTVGTDSGADALDGVEQLNRYGTCFENVWPYDVAQFTARPSTNAFRLALKDRVLKSSRVGADAASQKAAIAAGDPFGFGFSVPESFESDQTAASGLMAYPAKGEQVIGGHEVVRIGWDDGLAIAGNDGKTYTGAWECRNSWGQAWGQAGYFWMPYDLGNDPNWCQEYLTVERI